LPSRTIVTKVVLRGLRKPPRAPATVRDGARLERVPQTGVGDVKQMGRSWVVPRCRVGFGRRLCRARARTPAERLDTDAHATRGTREGGEREDGALERAQYFLAKRLPPGETRLDTRRWFAAEQRMRGMRRHVPQRATPAAIDAPRTRPA
jgi:hypothetical protein